MEGYISKLVIEQYTVSAKALKEFIFVRNLKQCTEQLTTVQLGKRKQMLLLTYMCGSNNRGENVTSGAYNKSYILCI